MINVKQLNRLILKTSTLADVYTRYLVTESHSLNAELFCTRDHYTAPPQNADYRPVKEGDVWGGDFVYGWFRVRVAVPSKFACKTVYLYNANGATENLVFMNGVPCGMFDVVPGETPSIFRPHKYLKLDVEPGAQFDLHMEGYAGHSFPGTMPRETLRTFGLESGNSDRVYQGISLVTIDADVERFLDNLYLFNKLYNVPNASFLKAELARQYEELFKVLEYMPSESPYTQGLIKANKLFESFFAREEQKEDTPYIGLIGHSHLDTAWLWTVPETRRKAARTVSNALRLMKEHKDYTFIMSSALHLDWLKQGYPDIFAEVKERVAAGQFEPNGGVWVECDCNLTGSESMVRQFLVGQLYLRDNLGYESDTFWLPDTFGYSAALPQIMRGANIKYFCTTKLSWNDTNTFPYESFVWRGIDGSEIVTHFNTTHCCADPDTVAQRAEALPNKHNNGRALISYGFGDGGGGPDAKMVEYAFRTEKIAGIPKAEHTTVSRFMQGFEKTHLPVYNGELYLEMHRGTLTSNHLIKSTNRRLEHELHNMDFFGAVCAPDKQEARTATNEIYKVLMQNQFHDILPGTCIREVHETAIQQNTDAIADAVAEYTQWLTGKGKGITLVNTLSFDRDEIVSLSASQTVGVKSVQMYKGIDGEEMAAVHAIISAYSVSNPVKADKADSSFLMEGKVLTTPFYRAEFDGNMRITSLVDIEADREVASGALNDYEVFDDVPWLWDNWDIDADYILKRRAEPKLLSSTVISDGIYQFRIRAVYGLTGKSTITVDTVFESVSRKIVYECKLDWQDKHKLLKSSFPLNILSSTLKSEIQFGHLDRPINDNTTIEQACYEVSNHKWSDISESGYGAALLNDCKYGISCRDGVIKLTLIKSGTHPDETADIGTHYFKYCLLPHMGSFSAENVVRPAYAFNIPPVALRGDFSLDAPVRNISRPNIICETIKIAEHGSSTVLRLYECERNRTKVKLSLNCKYKIELCNLLEDTLQVLSTSADSLELEFAPFQIVTLKLVGI